MPDLKDCFFEGDGDLPDNRRRFLTTPSAGTGLRPILEAYGWDGGRIATICLSTTNDGTRVSSATFAVWGPLSADNIEVPATKLWEGVPRGTNLHIRNLQGELFRFSGGLLQSEHLDSVKVEHSFSKGGNPILPADWEANNLGPFTLRLFAYVDKTANKHQHSPHIKLTVLVTPGTAEQLATLSERTQHPTWPGIRILEAQADLFPQPDAAERWGCPILPFICVRERADDCDAVPPGNHLRFAIAEVFRTVALPTACASVAAMLLKGNDILEAEGDPERRLPTITWPAHERPSFEQGNFILEVYKTR